MENPRQLAAQSGRAGNCFCCCYLDGSRRRSITFAWTLATIFLFSSAGVLSIRLRSRSSVGGEQIRDRSTNCQCVPGVELHDSADAGFSCTPDAALARCGCPRRVSTAGFAGTSSGVGNCGRSRAGRSSHAGRPVSQLGSRVCNCIGVLLWRVQPQALPPAIPILLLWASSKLVSGWLNQSPIASRGKLPRKELLFFAARRYTLAIFCRVFAQRNTTGSFQITFRKTPPAIAARVSPTNLGLLLNARQVAGRTWLSHGSRAD